jgi:hypothetical protein
MDNGGITIVCLSLSLNVVFLVLIKGTLQNDLQVKLKSLS